MFLRMEKIKGIIDEIKVPEGKDVNDLTEKEFKELLNENKT